MELFSFPWWSALLTIVLIDLVLAGDNAIVIALAHAISLLSIKIKPLFGELLRPFLFALQ